MRDDVEDAAANEVLLTPLVRVARAEQPLKGQPGNRLLRHRLGFAPPRDVRGIGAAVTRIAAPGIATAGQPQFDRGQAGLPLQLLGADLVDRNPQLYTAGRLQRPGRGQERRRSAGVVAGAILLTAAVVVGQAVDHVDLGFERRQRRERFGELPLMAGPFAVPLRLDHAIGDKQERHPHRPLGGRWSRRVGAAGQRRHRFEKRQPHHGTGTAEQRPSFQVPIHHAGSEARLGRVSLSHHGLLVRPGSTETDGSQ